MIASCSAWNSDQEYVCFKWFWAVEISFSKCWNQRHLVTCFGTKFYYDRIVLSVKFWSRICLFQLVLSSRSAFFLVLKWAPPGGKFGNQILLWSHRAQREILIKYIFVSNGSEQKKCLFLSVEISAIQWQVLELYFILSASCSAWNSDQEYVCFKRFWAEEVPFSKCWNQRHPVTSFGTIFYFERIVLSVKFWSGICLFQTILSRRSAFF
jgi:hypothetical protein